MGTRDDDPARQVAGTLTSPREELSEEPRGGARGPRAGDLVGRYVVEEELASGGMGVVVAARDPGLDRRVALKLVRPDIGDRAYRERLVREARAMAQLEHPNVVRVYDAGEHRGEVFIAMELVRGETLARWMRATARPWRDVVARFIDAGRGLAAAHDTGMVHRDFKPDNVLIRGADGRVCVTDFGLAVPAVATDELHDELDTIDGFPSGAFSALDATVEASAPTPIPAPRSKERITLTRTGALVGTPAYMAPEQHRCGDVDVRADVFSFCVSLYEGLYGERPFTPPADPMASWASAFAAGVRAAPADREVPAALRRVLLRGLAIDPAARWPDVRALLAALERTRAPARAQRWKVAGVAAAAAVAVVAGGAIAVDVASSSTRDDAAVATTPAGYDDGLRQLRADDGPAAIATLERVTSAAPRFVPAWISLARAYQLQLDFTHAKAAAARAAALVDRGDRARGLEIEGLQAEIDQKWDIAIDRYQAYFRFYPRDVEVAVALAEVQRHGGHAKDTVATVQAAQAVIDDPRLAIAAARADDHLDDWPAAAAAADHAVTLGRALGANGIVSRGLVIRGVARAKLHRYDEGLADLDDARRIAEAAGDWQTDARQYSARTRVMNEKGDRAGTVEAADQAIAVDRKIGDPHGLAADLLNAASAHGDLGQLDRAGQLYVEAFGLLRSLDDKNLLANALTNYGAMLTDIGDRDGADKALREALAIARTAGFESLVALVTNDLAWNDFGRDLSQAEAEYREGAILWERLSDDAGEEASYNGIALVLATRGDHAGSLQAEAKALEHAAHLGDTTLASEHTWQAVYLEMSGDHARAAEIAVAAAELLRASQFDRDELLARAVAAAALAATGRPDAAKLQLARARELLGPLVPIDYQGAAAMWTMRAAIKLGDRAQARAIGDAIPTRGLAVSIATALAAERVRAK